MANEYTFLVLCSIVIAIFMPMVHGIALEHQAVEKWFDELPYAREKLTKLHFFYHETVSGNNPTSITVASNSNISLNPPFEFGVVNIIDDPLRIRPEPDSKIMDRFQGLYGSASMEEFGLLMAMNFVFTKGEYNGSTVSVLGKNPIMHEHREMSMIGGSGVFRLAHGIATTETTSFNVTSLNSIVEYQLSCCIIDMENSYAD